MDIKIGITQSPRELVIDSAQEVDAVKQAVAEALANQDGVLELADRRGRAYIVPSAKVAYVEIGEADGRRVGFAAGD
ncbi:MAG: DUF3107 domain-containing protein [Cumulibacter sp.]